MALKDLKGKRTGRKPGSKNSPRYARILMWAYHNLEKLDSKPPKEGQ
jgi:hypothetical protein